MLQNASKGHPQEAAAQHEWQLFAQHLQAGVSSLFHGTIARCYKPASLVMQALTPIQMATAATESYPWWPDILAMLNAACDGVTVDSAESECCHCHILLLAI